jgi:YfiH family protein
VSSGFQLSADGIYRCEAFAEKFSWQTHGFGTRLRNPGADVTLRQVHSASVLNAQGLTDRSHEGDALITDERHRSIGIRTADCVPILLVDCSHHAVAAIHAGWRGTAAGIAERTVHTLRNTFGTSAANLYAAIGPCIRSCCYEVGEDVAHHFAALFSERGPDRGKQMLDLPEANRRQLQAAGLAPEHIYDCGRCTACETGLFFSYRRQPEEPGRMTAAICRCA